MNILLDTHIFLWYLEGNQALSSDKKQLIDNQQNDIYVSISSFWEIIIKKSLNKLELKDNLNTIQAICIEQGFNIILIEVKHLIVLQELPFHHKDPFDRLIISQAISDNLYIMSNDGNFNKYSINLIV